jgi:hypothetical protein
MATEWNIDSDYIDALCGLMESGNGNLNKIYGEMQLFFFAKKCEMSVLTVKTVIITMRMHNAIILNTINTEDTLHCNISCLVKVLIRL